jgi:hypothetical protein
MNVYLKLAGGLAALLAAIAFVFVFPGAGGEDAIVSIVAAILGQLGLTKWRESYNLTKGYLKSKTIVGALLVVLPVVALSVFALFSIAVPEYVTYVLTALVVAGSGTALFGIFNVDKTTLK